MHISEYQLENKIKKKLRNKDLTFKELCQKIEMSETGLARTLKNNTIKLETLTKISQVLETPLMYFLENNVSAYIDSDINEYHKKVVELEKELKELKEQASGKQQIVEFLNNKDKANQDVLMDIIKLLSDNKNQPCSKALAEIKDIQKVKFLIEYNLINPDIFK